MSDISTTVRQALAALEQLIGAAQAAKKTLDASIKEGDPVHPVSASLTWPLSSALLAQEKLRAVDYPPLTEDEYRRFSAQQAARIARGEPWPVAPEPQPAAQSVTVEAVAEVVSRPDGPELLWLIEGGIDAVPEGSVLLVSPVPLTNDDGHGDVYLVPPPAEPLVADENWLQECAKAYLSSHESHPLDRLVSLLREVQARHAVAPLPTAPQRN